MTAKQLKWVADDAATERSEVFKRAYEDVCIIMRNDAGKGHTCISRAALDADLKYLASPVVVAIYNRLIKDGFTVTDTQVSWSNPKEVS